MWPPKLGGPDVATQIRGARCGHPNWGGPRPPKLWGRGHHHLDKIWLEQTDRQTDRQTRLKTLPSRILRAVIKQLNHFQSKTELLKQI